MNQAETDIITSGPFKVVKQAPVGIPQHRDAILQCPGNLPQIAMQEVDALGIIHLAVQHDEVVVCKAVLGDEHRQTVPLEPELAGII